MVRIEGVALKSKVRCVLENHLGLRVCEGRVSFIERGQQSLLLSGLQDHICFLY